MTRKINEALRYCFVMNFPVSLRLDVNQKLNNLNEKRAINNPLRCDID